MRTFEHPDPERITIDGVLSALADPIRRRIVRQLVQGPSVQTCSQFELPIGKSAQTYHFRVLREAGVIEQRYQGTAIMNSLRMEVLRTRLPGLIDAVLASERATTSATELPADKAL
ncbi:ArsR/SmtB family transcription factor [Rhodococcus koreensis]